MLPSYSEIFSLRLRKCVRLQGKQDEKTVSGHDIGQKYAEKHKNSAKHAPLSEIKRTFAPDFQSVARLLRSDPQHPQVNVPAGKWL